MVGKNWQRITSLESDMSDVGDKIDAGFNRIYDKIGEVKEDVTDIRERMASVETEMKVINGKE